MRLQHSRHAQFVSPIGSFFHEANPRSTTMLLSDQRALSTWLPECGRGRQSKISSSVRTNSVVSSFCAWCWYARQSTGRRRLSAAPSPHAQSARRDRLALNLVPSQMCEPDDFFGWMEFFLHEYALCSRARIASGRSSLQRTFLLAKIVMVQCGL